MRQEIQAYSSTALNEKQLAKLINVSVGLLRKWRREKAGPRWLKLGRVVRYLAKDVEAWLEARAVSTGTAEGRTQ